MNCSVSQQLRIRCMRASDDVLTVSLDTLDGGNIPVVLFDTPNDNVTMPLEDLPQVIRYLQGILPETQAAT